MKLLKEWSKKGSRNYIKISNKKLILSLPHIETIKIKLQKNFFLYNTKEKTLNLNQSSVVYKLTSPGCICNYIGTTEWVVSERTEEHVYHKKKSNKMQFMNICQLAPIIVT